MPNPPISLMRSSSNQLRHNLRPCRSGSGIQSCLGGHDTEELNFGCHMSSICHFHLKMFSIDPGSYFLLHPGYTNIPKPDLTVSLSTPRSTHERVG